MNAKLDPKTLMQVMKMLGAHYGPGSEFILHDMSKGIESTIVAIENGELTGRKVGDCGSNYGLEVMRFEGKSATDDTFGYNIYCEGDKVLRASTMFLKNDEGKIVGAFCINTDITPLMQLGKYAHPMLPVRGEEKNIDEFFCHSTSELLDTLIDNCKKLIGKDVEKMNKEDKLEAVRYLDSKGAFLISKAGPAVCRQFKISKGSLYSYIEQIRAEESSE